MPGLPARHGLGVASVNKFYDYYQTWGGMINDLTSQGAGNLPKYAAGGKGTNKQFDKNIGRVTSQAEDAQVGYLFQTPVTGARSHLTRDVLVYLPPQYFQKSFRHYKFPVIELLHGSPGGPRAWVDVMGVIPTFLSLLATHPKDAAVLVMPDTDGSPRYGLQCLNNPGGIQDMTFVARDVPDAIARIARVQPPGRAWGLAGYSEGGYCAANIGVQDPKGYGAAGVLSRYFARSRARFRPATSPAAGRSPSTSSSAIPACGSSTRRASMSRGFRSTTCCPLSGSPPAPRTRRTSSPRRTSGRCCRPGW